MNKSIEYLITELYREKWRNSTLELRDILQSLYVDDDLSIREVANELRLSITTTHKMLREYGVSKNYPKCM